MAKEKTIKKTFNDEVFADLYYEALGKSTRDNRSSLLKLKTFDRVAYNTAKKKYKEKMGDDVDEKFKDKLPQ